MDGVAIVDKPEGWTSHDVVAKFRGIAKTRRIGHLGTLDPMATGVLPLAIGVATRLARFYTASEKLYVGGVRFGFATDTYDRTGTPTSHLVPPAFSEERLEATLQQFRGHILQTPPQYSAKKVGGVTAYKAARRNIELRLEPVEIEIRELTLLRFDGSRADLRVRCSGGTYIRSLAQDLGRALGCGAHLDSLRRLASGEFTMERARPMEAAFETLVPLESLVPWFPAFAVDEAGAIRIRQGRSFEAPGVTAPYLRALSETGRLIAVCERSATALYHPFVVVG